MLKDSLLLIVSMLFIVSMLSMLSDKLRISYPIFLVIAGLGISLIPGIPRIQLDPDIVFIIFLPPLLYSAAWTTSWHDFWRLRRPIGLLAFGLVLCTSLTVAYFSHFLIPDFSLALGFLLGGIISPPDAVAATSVLQNLRVPKRLVSILEGESLVNDASSLIVFRFAMAALLTGKFVFWRASVDFLLVVFMGILIGLAIACIAYAIYRWLPTTPSIDTAISLICPYLMYIVAEHFHYSGVLAVVSGGLFLSYRSHDILSYDSRLQSRSVWNVLVFLLNGVVFILIGLQLHTVVHGLGEYSLHAAIWYGLAISLLTIVVRILWVYPGTYMPRLISKGIRTREPRPGPKLVFLTGWSGMRGVVSLASALAIPLTLPGGDAFPHRNLILFITFCVILSTLVVQGLTLPLIIRLLKIEVVENKKEQRLALRLELANTVVGHMNTHYPEESGAAEAFSRLKARYERMAAITEKQLEEGEDRDSPGFLLKYRQLLLDLVAIQRQELGRMRRENKYSDEILQDKETELDLEEARYRR
ncbi:Na+/H+ antiporter [Puia dinghuensis]|uniref:Na+/H+ antiporter n=1 Tax=Puia dinghuensis TaxID=1792502 RepID=A0A8J2UG59_9BACT|nr:Na+/H+ antiporter [Puia dinghuensis]GGB11149.1 Na+/H+ antiporter [Puia dinghuensis]